MADRKRWVSGAMGGGDSPSGKGGGRASGAMGSGDSSSGKGGGHRDPSGNGGRPWSAPAAPVPDIEAGRPTAVDGAAADEGESVEMRLDGLNAIVVRMGRMSVDSRREQGQMATILARVNAKVSDIDGWAVWLERVYDWMWLFPWR